MKILILTNIPSPYRVDFFNELGKYCDLTVVFEQKYSKLRDKSWEDYKFHTFQGVFMKGIKFYDFKVPSLSVIRYLPKNVYDHIIVMNYSNPIGWIEIAILKVRKIPYLVEGDGAFAKSDKGMLGFLKKSMKKFLLNGASGYFSTAELHDEYYLKYGASNEKIFRYPFTSIRRDDILKTVLTIGEKHVLRKKLNIKEEKMVLAVGQFIYRKGFDILLQAASKMDKGIGFYIIGGIPTEEMQQYVTNNALINIHFLPFQKTEKLCDYYKIADVFVLPTREDIWGLVVNEAMANGVPVITTNACISGREMVRNGQNGYLIPTECPDLLKESIEKILKEDPKKLSEEALLTAQWYTIENMAKEHIKILERM